MADRKPLDLIGHQQAQLRRAGGAILLLSLTLCILVSVGGWYVVRGLPQHFIPPGGPGISIPGVIPDLAATDFASRCLQARYGFTPPSIQTAHAAFSACLHPALLVIWKAKAEKEVLFVKEHQLSTQTVVETTAVTRPPEGGVVVTITARRAVWIGGHQVRDEPLQATFTLVPWEGSGRPVGLAILKFDMLPALSVSGT